MRRTLRDSLLLCALVMAPAVAVNAQEAPKPEPSPPQPVASADSVAAQPAEGTPDVDGALSFEISYGLMHGYPSLRGHPTSTGASPNLAFPGKSVQAPGATLSIPAGRFNNLRLSYFQTRGGGDTTAASDLNLFDTAYSKGDLLVANYKLQNVKVSYDYLSYPAPPKGAKFRLKTLWELQYTNFKAAIDTRNKTDSSGAITSNPATGSRWFIYPTLGVGIEHFVSRNFRWEAKASGFAIPHHADIWDAQVWAAYRIGQFEPRVGVRGFHFKTSPKKDQYIGGTTYSGVYVNFRWYPKLPHASAYLGTDRLQHSWNNIAMRVRHNSRWADH